MSCISRAVRTHNIITIYIHKLNSKTIIAGPYNNWILYLNLHKNGCWYIWDWDLRLKTTSTDFYTVFLRKTIRSVVRKSVKLFRSFDGIIKPHLKQCLGVFGTLVTLRVKKKPLLILWMKLFCLSRVKCRQVLFFSRANIRQYNMVTIVGKPW